MPPGRTCPACGAAFPADLRWCTRCYEPVRAFTPRAPIHDGDFVGMPIATGGHAPHWSRWEKSATTFGPVGRLTATALFLCSLPLALSFGMVLYIVMFPVVATVVLGGIWAKGWVVPDEAPERPPLPVTEREETVVQPTTPAMRAFRIVVWVAVFAGCAVFAYGPVAAKAVVLAVGTLVGLYAFYRGILSR